MTYPTPPHGPGDDPTPSLRKDGPWGAEQPGPAGEYPGPQYGDQQYGAYPPEQPRYGTPFGQGPYGAPPGPYGQPYGIPIVPQTNGKAIGALVCGIASFLTCLLFIGIPAVILGNMATAEIEASGGTQSGSGMAQAGRILGWVATGLMIVALVIILILVIAVGVSE